jgi:hypothetical protein
MHRLLAALLLSLAASTARPDPQADLAVRALREDGSMKVRAQAAIALGQRHDPSAVPALAAALESDQAAAVRIAAASALGRLGARSARSARPPLADAARSDPDPAVREACARALEALAEEGGRAVSIEEPSGTAGGAAARAELRRALEKHLRAAGFAVVARGGVRLKPAVLKVDVDGWTIAVRAGLVAVDGDGRMAAMLEGGAKLRASSAIPEDRLAAYAAKALDAAARTLTEDLAASLGRR